jgi:nucleoside 2-deoxyribosyltransferase
VFFPDARAIFTRRARLCRELGLEPLIPLDDALTTAPAIYEGNVALIERADAVIANIQPFRGPHCDVGTAWEIGYAVARAKPVFAFSADRRKLIERLSGVTRDGRDRDGNLAEDFGLAENLMIAACVEGRTVFGSFEDAARAVAAQLLPQGSRARLSR